jgi:hypothetical protein
LIDVRGLSPWATVPAMTPHLLCERHSVTLDVAKYLVEEIPDDICCYCNKPADQKGLVLNGKPNCSHELEVAGRP